MALPPSFVILLERDEKRVENVRDNILNIIPECEIFTATDGRNMNMFDVCSLISTNLSYRLNPSVIACHLSHLKVLKLIVERRLASAIIFEDDVKVVPDFRNRLGLLLDEIPDDYDHVYLYTHPKYKLEDDTPFLIPEKNHVRRYSYTYCNLAYFVSFNGAKKLVNYLSQPVYAPLDFMVNDLIGNGRLTSYMSRTMLVENLGQLTSIYNRELLPSNIFPPNSFQSKAWHSFRRALIRASKYFSTGVYEL
jgi:GR25 family glycosyltransferase involved in LPS biosynthesis